MRTNACAILTSLILLPSISSSALADLVVPTNGMVITTDTTFAPGTYNLPSGVNIGADGITLDMNGAVLIGSGGTTYGVTSIGRSHASVALRAHSSAVSRSGASITQNPPTSSFDSA